MKEKKKLGIFVAPSDQKVLTDDELAMIEECTSDAWFFEEFLHNEEKKHPLEDALKPYIKTKKEGENG